MNNQQFAARPSPLSLNTVEGSILYPALVNHLSSEFCEPKITNAYKAENGNIIFGFGYSNWYILPANTNEAHKIAYKGYGGTSKKFGVTFACDVNEQQIARLEVDEDLGKARYDDIELSILSEEDKTNLLESCKNKEISLVDIPDFRKIEKALQFSNGDYLLVSCSSADYSYETLRMFTGPSLENLREIKIVNVDRYRDGGTTFYKTDEGTLYTPPPFEDKSSTWTPLYLKEAIKLTKLNPADIAAEIGQSDTRICGAKTWAEYQAVENATEPQRADGKSWTEASSDRNDRGIS